MKKLWLLPVLAIFLAACGSNDEKEPAKDEDISVDVIEPETEPEETETESTAEPADEKGAAEEGNTEEQPAAADSDLSGYEEADVLGEHMPVDELTPIVETDNPGKRIILFEDADGQKVYKSIFIKHDQHVKIIDLKKDGLVYEGRL